MTKSAPLRRVDVTDEAAALLVRLMEQHGPLLFHQSGGCCDGSSPMCFPRDEFHVSDRDVYLGDIVGTPFYMGANQYKYWAHTHLSVDVVKGRGSGFSVEAPEGVRFLIRSYVFSDDELAALPSVEHGDHHTPES